MEPPVKILHVFHSFNMGGLENGVVNLVNRLDTARFQHEICCLSILGIAAGRLERPTPIFEMHKRDGNDWRMVLNLIKLMRARHPDIVHTRNWGGVDGIIAAKAAGISRIIHGEHGWNLDDPRGRNPRRRRIRRLLSPWVKRVVAVSADIQNWLIQDVGIREDKVSLIPNGVDTDKFRPGDPVELKRALGFSTSDRVIGCVGRFDPVKNHPLLIKAFSRLKHDLPIHLVLLGDGPEKHHLEDLRDSLLCRDRIHFVGQRENVAELLRIMDIFVLPSRSEGICNALLEAMASGIPIIATAVGGNIELVQDGHTGLLVSSEDEDSMVHALNLYLEDASGLSARVGQNARRKAEQDYSLRHMIQSYESLYLSVA